MMNETNLREWHREREKLETRPDESGDLRGRLNKREVIVSGWIQRKRKCSWVGKESEKLKREKERECERNEKRYKKKPNR